jgi:pimeloyl-ACP methyl ester carboxylesterase
LLLLAFGTLSAQNQEHRVRNIVLVHGAWADGSGWKGVYDILVKGGYNVSIVQEPETSFKEDVAATKRTLALQDGPCILVGHSYGGAVITEAGMDPSVVGLVYIAAHVGGRRLARNDAEQHLLSSPELNLPKFDIPTWTYKTALVVFKRRSCVQAVIRRRWRMPNLLVTDVLVLPRPCPAAGRASIDEL